MLTGREMHFHTKLHPLDSSPLESRDFFPRQRKFPVNIRRRFNSFRHGGRVRMFEWPQLMPVNQKRHVVAAINKSVPPLVCIFTGDYFKAPRAQIHATDEEVVDALAEWRMQLIPAPWLRHGWLIFRNNSVAGDLQFELWAQRNRLFISNITKWGRTRLFVGGKSIIKLYELRVMIVINNWQICWAVFRITIKKFKWFFKYNERM